MNDISDLKLSHFQPLALGRDTFPKYPCGYLSCSGIKANSPTVHGSNKTGVFTLQNDVVTALLWEQDTKCH